VASESTPTIIDRARSDALIREAQGSSRLRSHLLLHQDHSDQVQRLLVAFSNGTYIQPHCHPEQWEMIVPLRDELTLLIFSTDGVVLRRQALRHGDVGVAHVPAGAWHTLLTTMPTALMLEAKPGPYRPAQFAPWSPEESHPQSRAYATRLAEIQEGMSAAFDSN
jgi:cupin fold WbuC family metalloprotein